MARTMARHGATIFMTRAHTDKEFRTELLKELLRLAVASDPELLEKAVARVEKGPRNKKKPQQGFPVTGFPVGAFFVFVLSWDQNVFVPVRHLFPEGYALLFRLGHFG